MSATRRLSFMTVLVFVVSLTSGLAVQADEHDGDEMKKKDREKYEKKYEKYKHKYKKYKHKYKKYKVKYYHAKKDEKERDHDRMKMLWKGIEKLDFSDDQKDELHEVKYDWKLEKIDLKSAVKKQKVRLKRLKKRDNASQNQLNSRIDALYDAKAEYKKGKYQFKSDLMNVLTDEQKKELKSMKEKHHKGRKDKKDYDRDHDEKDDRDRGSDWF